MKTLLIFAVLVFGTVSTSLCDDIKTTDGKEYKNAIVSRTEPDGIIITTNSGIIKLYFSELPQNVRVRYNYDPKRAQDFAAADARQQQLLHEQTQRDRAAVAQQQAATAAAAITTRTDTFTRTAEGNKEITARKEAPQESISSGTALNQRPTGQTYFMQGRVVQVIEGKGILLSTVRSRTFGIPEPRDHSLVFVGGTFEPTLDNDDVLAMYAREAGTYRYTTVQGAEKAVVAYQFESSRTPMAPFIRDSASRRYIEQ